MIRGIHGLLYSSDPDATRSFFRSVMKLPGSDIGGGWWIFDLAEGDLGVHPVDDPADAGGHDVSFYCDDLEAVVAGLRARGATPDEIMDRGFGLVSHVDVPGRLRVMLYQPKYQKASPPAPAAKKAARKSANKSAKKAAKKAPKKTAKKTAKKAATKKAAKKKARRSTR
jgi:hypothetical protein